MPSYLHFLTLLSLFFLTNSIVLKVGKDPFTLQYITHLNKGTPITPTELVLDLGGPFLWETCHVSSSYRLIRSASLECSMANPNSGNGCYSETCDVAVVNSVARSTMHGELAEDIVAADHVGKAGNTGLGSGPVPDAYNFVFACAPPLLLGGLASGAKGMLGLGRTRIALPSQVLENRIFFLCLSSTDGAILSDDDGPNFPVFGREIRDSLSYTPLIPNQAGTLSDYYINMRSIKVNGRQISVSPVLLSRGAKLSTVVPYTTMESSIYDTFTSAYVSAATAMNLTRVAARSRFGVCFDSGAGPNVPVIDFVLQSEMVAWRFYGRNSMVHVGDNVMCLGFMDGGLGVEEGVVIGGYQLEDQVLEFDLGTNMMGFSSSLFMRQTSCSNFNFSRKDSE